MKISYLALYNAADIHKWSGAGYYISKALEKQNAHLDYIDKIHVPVRYSLKKFSYSIINKNFNFQRTISFAKQFAEKANPLIKSDSNILFSPGSIALSLIQTKIPKVFYTDATFASILNFYETYTNLSPEIIEQGHYLEQKALESAALAIYSSEWAANSAINYYKTDPKKVKVVPFGANIDSRRSYNDIKDILTLRPSKECNLLFIGVNWKRKGGDMAVKVAGELNRQGLKTKLHVVGIKDLDTDDLPDFVINHGYISKSTEEGKRKIEQLLAESHFLIVPSKAEAYGIVFCEASSFGLPSLATNVGGIPGVVRDNINGKTFSLEKTEMDYAEFILDHFYNHAKYQDLVFSSFNEFEKRLNWDVAGKSLMNLMKEI